MELGRQLNACMDMISLRVMDKINSFEDALNRKLTSFETQLRELSHPVPSLADGADKVFEVTLFHWRVYIRGPHSGLAPSEISCGENAVLPQRGRPRVAEIGCSRGRGGIGLPGWRSHWTHIRPPSYRPYFCVEFVVEPTRLPSICSKLFCGTVPGHRGKNLHGRVLRISLTSTHFQSPPCCGVRFS